MGEAIDTPSGDLKRDLSANKRVTLWRPQPQVIEVRAMPDKGPRVLRFVLATPGVKRDGHSVDCSPEAWDLTVAKERCPMLWMHGYGDDGGFTLPQIGEWRSIEFEQDGGEWRMVGDGEFSAAWEGRAGFDLPGVLFAMYSPKDQGGDNFRGASSIGWTPLEAEPNEFGGYHMKRNILNEASLVTMGADQKALQVMVRSGMPETFASNLAANRLSRAAEARHAYLLDFRAYEVWSNPESGEPKSEPEVRMIQDDTVVTFEAVKDGVAFVLERRGQADQKSAQRQVKLCRQALSEKKPPELDAGWRAVVVLPGRPMKLERSGATEDERRRIATEMAEALGKGEPVVLPPGWTLRSLSRSDRSDALDILTAQLMAFLSGAIEPIRRIAWSADSVFYQDETGENYGGGISTEQRIEREIKIARSMLSGVMDILDAIESTLEPSPEITGTAMTASLQRVGKKYAAATVKKLKEMLEHNAAQGSVLAAMLEEAEALSKAEDETASGESEFARLAADLDDAVSGQRPEAAPAIPPSTRTNPLEGLTRAFSENKAGSLSDLAESLRGAA